MKEKKMLISRSELLKEHKRIVPMLRQHGLKEEAIRQAKEYKELKRK